MLLNSKFNLFRFAFPRGFFYPDIEQRYEIFFKRLAIPYTNLTDFMSYTVQSVSWPSMTGETVTQQKKGVTPFYKGGWDASVYIGKEVTVTFRTVEGYLNYFVMQDMFTQYWELNDPDEATFVPDLSMQLLDYYGYLLITMQYRSVVFSGISELELSYASNVPEYKTFTCTFNCATVDIKRALD